MDRDHVILILGEDDNDKRALKNLVRAILPANRSVPIETRRRPTILSRDAKRKRLKMAEEIKVFMDAESIRTKHVDVVVHRDCDSVEPAHIEEEKSLREILNQVGLYDVVVAAPAWEIETWWMLFPEALSAVRGCWRKVNYRGRHVGMIARAKEQLRRDLRPKHIDSKRCPDFVESDGILVSELIAEGRLVEKLKNTRSDSFQCFRKQVQAAGKLASSCNQKIPSRHRLSRL
jgi:hypothetical protein